MLEGSIVEFDNSACTCTSSRPFPARLRSTLLSALLLAASLALIGSLSYHLFGLSQRKLHELLSSTLALVVDRLVLILAEELEGGISSDAVLLAKRPVLAHVHSRDVDDAVEDTGSLFKLRSR